MSTTAEELVVALRAEGADDVSDSIDDVGNQVESTTDTVKDQSTSLEGFTNRIKGVMTAVLAGIAIAAAGITSTIPAIGGVLEGFTSVVQAIGLQLDKRLGGSIRGFTDDLFELSSAIAQGDFKQAKEIFEGWGQALTGIDFTGLFGDIVNGISDFVVNGLNKLSEMDLRSRLNDFLDKLGTTVDTLLSEGDFGQNFREIISALGDFLKSQDWIGIATDLVNFLGGAIATFIKETDWNQWLDFIVDGIENWIDDVDWASVGSRIGSALVSGIKRGGGFLLDMLLGDFESGFESGRDLTGPGILERGMNMDFGSSDNTSNGGGGGQFAGLFGGGGGGISLDGRQVTESTGRYRADASRRRGI